MQGHYAISTDAERADAFMVVGEDGAAWWLRLTEVGDVEGQRMLVQRHADRILIADEFTGRVAASGSFVTKNICRPPAAVSRFPEMRHYALEGPDLERGEFHLGSGPGAALGFILTPDGRRLARLAREEAGSATLEVSTVLDWRPVLAAVHLAMFPPPPERLLYRLRRRLSR